MAFRYRLLAVLAFLLASCADMYTQRPVGASVELSENCAAGPYCVTGAVTGQNGAPVAGARCIAEWLNEEPTITFSDRRGLFLMSALHAIPRRLRFEKDGFDPQTLSVVALLRQRFGAEAGIGAEIIRPRAPADAARPTSEAAIAEPTASNPGGGESIAEPARDADASTKRLLGDDFMAGDLAPEDLFDFGTGSTLRVIVTLRRAQ